MSLGCSALILIALIVLCFGNMAGEDVANQIQHLDTRVQNLESVVKEQTETIRNLQTSIESLRKELGHSSEAREKVEDTPERQ